MCPKIEEPEKEDVKQKVFRYSNWKGDVIIYWNALFVTSFRMGGEAAMRHVKFWL